MVPVDHVENLRIDLLLHPLLRFFEIACFVFQFGYIDRRKIVLRPGLSKRPVKSALYQSYHHIRMN
jgi:hypothetical protein